MGREKISGGCIKMPPAAMVSEESLTFSVKQPHFAARLENPQVDAAGFRLRPTALSVIKIRLRKLNPAVTLWRGSTGQNRI